MDLATSPGEFSALPFQARVAKQHAAPIGSYGRFAVIEVCCSGVEI